MPLELIDFNQAGLEVDALALIVAVAPPNIYADADRGGSQSPEAGSDIGIGPGQTLISRIGITSSGENVRLNDNDNPVALTMRAWFGEPNQTSPWRLYIQTDGGITYSQQLGNTGRGFANFQFDAAGTAILNAIAAGDRFLIALARRLLPVAASIDAQAGSVTVALTKQAPANKAVAASFGAAAGSVTVALTKSGRHDRGQAHRGVAGGRGRHAVRRPGQGADPAAARGAGGIGIERRDRPLGRVALGDVGSHRASRSTTASGRYRSAARCG